MPSLTFSQQINLLAERVGTECRSIYSKMGGLEYLTTSDKTNVVLALNEVRTGAQSTAGALSSLSDTVTALSKSVNSNAQDILSNTNAIQSLTEAGTAVSKSIADLQNAVGSAAKISDDAKSASSTYSSNKVEDLITAAKKAVKDELLGGAGEAIDTLQELADLIAANKTSLEALQKIAEGYVAFDKAQTLTAFQKSQALANIGAADKATVDNHGTRLTAAETAVNANTNTLTTLNTNLGDMSKDFVATFEAALQ